MKDTACITRSFRLMSWSQLLVWLFVSAIQMGIRMGWGVYLMLMTLARFAFYLTTGGEEEQEVEEAQPIAPQE